MVRQHLQIPRYRRGFLWSVASALVIQAGSMTLSECARFDIKTAIMIVGLSMAFGFSWLLICLVTKRVKYPFPHWRNTFAFAIQFTLLITLMDRAGQCTAIASTHYWGNSALLALFAALAYHSVLWINGKFHYRKPLK